MLQIVRRVYDVMEVGVRLRDIFQLATPKSLAVFSGRAQVTTVSRACTRGMSASSRDNPTRLCSAREPISAADRGRLASPDKTSAI